VRDVPHAAIFSVRHEFFKQDGQGAESGADSGPIRRSIVRQAAMFGDEVLAAGGRVALFFEHVMDP